MKLPNQHYELYELTRDCADTLVSIETWNYSGRNISRFVPVAQGRINALREYLNSHATDEIVRLESEADEA